jgi:hypothetical protein
VAGAEISRAAEIDGAQGTAEVGIAREFARECAVASILGSGGKQGNWNCSKNAGVSPPTA